MKNLFPSASACFVVMFVATVGYAESQVDDAAAEQEVSVSAESSPEGDSRSDSEATAGESVVERSKAESAEPKGDAVPVTRQRDSRGKHADDGQAGSDSRQPAGDSPDPASELSVAPMSHVTFPEDRPSWVTREPVLEGPVHSWVVVTSGYDSIEQCEDELKVLSKAAVALYIKESADWVCGDDFVTEDWVENELTDRRYVGKFVKGDRTLNEMAVELRFDDQARHRIERAKREVIVDDRLKASGGLFALGLIGLCCTGGLLGIFSRRYT